MSVAARATKASAPKPTGATEMVHVRVSEKLKRDATETLEQIGMSLPEAVRLFMHRVVAEQALPLRLEVPNAVTRAAIEASRKRTGVRHFASPTEMFDELEKAGPR